MAGQKLKSARAIAVQVLNRCVPKRNYAGPMLDRLLHKTDQRQRATDLVFGTLRNRLAIDMVIANFSGRPVQRIQPELLNIIRIGTYELVHSPATGQYAIVNEAVGNTKTIAGEKQAGFVNAVLRQIIRHISNRQIPLDQAHISRTLPQTPSTGCEFDTDFLPDNEVSVGGYLSMAFSLPEWLVADWIGEFSEESTRQICFASNRRPSIYIRPNLLRTTMDALVERLREAGIDLETDADNSMIRIKSPQAVPQLGGFKEGQFTVQDITASQPVRLLNPQPGWTILDLCAAPGTKTTQLAELTDDAAKIIATDIDARRLEMVKENIARLGVNSVDIIPYDELLGMANVQIENSFDCVLLDVPCSNTGVLARRIEARYRISPTKMQGLTRIQAGLLDRAAGIVKPNGKICYSTCSIQDIENERLVEDFLKKNKNFTLESERLTLPSAEGLDHDGGYAAILTKIKA
ncbi:MAG TPA: 16S rRNA (cytosine(967)-C(5))-methyltransferase RsmB [Phycisphaerales bacterium]|nr:16S rRNA (cytosine(967)-C(5))-methyltransferase RsmB [Phycisphaerales bacterium]